MATTSIWAVKGWLGKVVLYIENPDKTDNPKFYRQEELTDVQTQNLSDVIDYAVRAEKTTVTPDDESAMVVRQFISGINCLPYPGWMAVTPRRLASPMMPGMSRYAPSGDFFSPTRYASSALVRNSE